MLQLLGMPLQGESRCAFVAGAVFQGGMEGIMHRRLVRRDNVKVAAVVETCRLAIDRRMPSELRVSLAFTRLRAGRCAA